MNSTDKILHEMNANLLLVARGKCGHEHWPPEPK